MSANIIRSQYDDLEQIAARFAAQAEAVQEQQQRIEQHVAVLEGGGWQGQGIETFSREMRGEVFPAVERLHQALAEAQKVTLAVSVTMRTAEEEAAALFEMRAYFVPPGIGIQGWSDNVPPPRIYIVNGINSLGDVPGRIGDDDSIALEDLIESRGYDPSEVLSTPAIYGRPWGGNINLDGTNLSGTDYGGWLSPIDWYTNAVAGEVNFITGFGAKLINAGSYVESSLYGAGEVVTEYFRGEDGRYTQSTYDFIQRDLADNPLLPGQTVVLMGHSGGGAVIDELPGMLERGTGYDVSATVTLASPISNYDVASRYAERIVEIEHQRDIVGQSYIRSDETRAVAPWALSPRAYMPVPWLARLAGVVGLEATVWRNVGDAPQVDYVTNRGATDNPHGSVMISNETVDALARLFPEMQLDM